MREEQGGSSPLTRTALCGGLDRLQGKSWSHLGAIRPHESRGPGGPETLRGHVFTSVTPRHFSDQRTMGVLGEKSKASQSSPLPSGPSAGRPSAPPDKGPQPLSRMQLCFVFGLHNKGAQAGQLYQQKPIPSQGWRLEVPRSRRGRGWLLLRPLMGRAAGRPPSSPCVLTWSSLCAYLCPISFSS